MITVPAICSPWSDELDGSFDVAVDVQSEAKHVFLFRLPPELLQNIFDNLQRFTDVAAFASVHPYLFFAGRCRIEHWAERFAPWADQRLVYPVVAYARHQHIPLPKFMSEDKALTASVGAGPDAFHKLLATCTLVSRETATDGVRRPLSFAELRARHAVFDWPQWGGAGFWHYPPARRWVLCNASKGVYASLDAFAPDAGPEHDMDAYPRDAQRVYDRLCTLIRIEPGFEGPWAGDRVKIVVRESLRADRSATGAWVEKTWDQLSAECDHRIPESPSSWCMRKQPLSLHKSSEPGYPH
ncbi:hypothetical protein PsYK624_064170 [Phanerochaete sordida]|uniref:F-box domain-containing protein n=1 Tax=Phanerochaete sordida TaxID=48140 RepID=A0A9P3G6Q2_9APHY|nr:hypothetical protein PsYK624_064170 [Phanerochaete sordida]